LNLYTVTIVFEDRTLAIEQVRESSPMAALISVLRNAEAMAKYTKPSMDKLVSEYSNSYQVADRKGVWNWRVFPIKLPGALTYWAD